jgi:hypothetical protein
MKNVANKRRGRPLKEPEKVKSIRLDMRILPLEKEAFVKAAEIAGLDLSSWIRERLRQASRAELEDSGHVVPFLPTVDEFLRKISNV